MSRRRSGMPPGDRQAGKDERAAQRAARQEESARKRQRAVLRQWVTRVAIAAAGIGLVAWLVIPGRGDYSPGGTGAFIDGVRRFQNPTGHTLDLVAYPQTPPAGGEHNPTWLNCGIYTQPVPNTYAVHSLEHGAVWVTYRPELSAEDLSTLREFLPASYVILSPFAGLPSPIVLSGWNVQLGVDGPNDPRLPQFLEEYWRSQNVPEPGALCTGGMDGPGRS